MLGNTECCAGAATAAAAPSCATLLLRRIKEVLQTPGGSVQNHPSMDANEPSPLQMELSIARGEEAEALRRALHLRQMAAPYSDINAAVQEAELHHARVNALRRQLRDVQMH
jgi:hypothetical protein